MPLQIITNFDAVAARFTRMAEQIATQTETERVLISEALSEATIAIIMAHTPVSEGGEIWGNMPAPTPGTLRDSTIGEIVPDQLDTLITFRQTALSAPNADGSGGGVPYVGWVMHGRGPIDVNNPGPYSTGKKALAGPGFGPVTHVGPAAANPYIDDSMAEAEGEIGPLLEGAGRFILGTVIGVIG